MKKDLIITKYYGNQIEGFSYIENKFLKLFFQKHGLEYDYSKFKYVNSTTKVTIICRKHGDFLQNANKHKNGQGCPTCGLEKTKSKQRTSVENLLKKFELKHGNLYDYSQMRFININKNIKIICKIHGVFEQRPSKHLHHGCNKCGYIKEFNEDAAVIESFKKVHGNRYIYDDIKYTGARNNVRIKCRQHGYFEQISKNHKSGAGCPECAKIKKIRNQVLKPEKVLKQFYEVHKKFYDYSLMEYKGDKIKIKIICPEHGVFKQIPADHKRGKGCLECSSSGFDKTKSAILYYIRINKDGKEAYKIGITNRSVQERFVGESKYITVIKLIYYEFGIDAYKEEQNILEEFKFAKWDDSNLLTNGNTELFKYDVLSYDT